MQTVTTIIPTYTEYNQEGFFLGQVVCPKKDHTVRWQVGKIIGAHRFDLSIGPVLWIEDMVTGGCCEELPKCVDMLVAQNIFPEYGVLTQRLVTPVFPGDFDWQIGRIAGFLGRGTDRVSLDVVLITDIQTGGWRQVDLAKINFLIRRETDFAKFQK
jgi:hypothetical protein